MRWCMGRWVLLSTLALFPVLIVGRLLAQEPAEHVLRESPLTLNMNRLIQSTFKDNDQMYDSKRLPTTVINPQQQQQHAASLPHGPMPRVHGTEEFMERILHNSFADYVDPGSNTNPGVVDPPIPGIFPPPLPL